MIALDTNVWVRYLVEDDAEQTERATQIIETAIERDEAIFVSLLTLAEIVWVLSARYRFPRPQIVEALDSLYQVRSVVWENRRVVRDALDRYTDDTADLADYLMLEHSLAAGCRHFVTFDRALRDEDSVVEP